MSIEERVNMKLDDEQRKKLEKTFLDEPYKSLKCPVCQREDFSINTSIFEFSDFQPGLLRPIPQSMFPVIVIVCEKCGHSITFSAIKLGLIKRKDERNTGNC